LRRSTGEFAARDDSWETERDAFIASNRGKTAACFIDDNCQTVA
jgi:hypothetical protein